MLEDRILTQKVLPCLGKEWATTETCQHTTVCQCGTQFAVESNYSNRRNRQNIQPRVLQCFHRAATVPRWCTTPCLGGTWLGRWFNRRAWCCPNPTFDLADCLTCEESRGEVLLFYFWTWFSCLRFYFPGFVLLLVATDYPWRRCHAWVLRSMCMPVDAMQARVRLLLMFIAVLNSMPLFLLTLAQGVNPEDMAQFLTRHKSRCNTCWNRMTKKYVS